jgi:hypothetical protein
MQKGKADKTFMLFANPKICLKAAKQERRLNGKKRICAEKFYQHS